MRMEEKQERIIGPKLGRIDCGYGIFVQIDDDERDASLSCCGAVAVPTQAQAQAQTTHQELPKSLNAHVYTVRNKT